MAVWLRIVLGFIPLALAGMVFWLWIYPTIKRRDKE